MPGLPNRRCGAGRGCRRPAPRFIPIADRQELTKAAVDIDVDITYGFFSDLHPGDTEYNNMHFLWGRSISSEPTDVYILITSSGVSLGIEGVDLYFDNYTLLARDGELSVR